MRDLVRLVVSVALGVTLLAFAIYLISVLIGKLACILFHLNC
jgi:hypothetical protein